MFSHDKIVYLHEFKVVLISPRIHFYGRLHVAEGMNKEKVHFGPITNFYNSCFYLNSLILGIFNFSRLFYFSCPAFLDIYGPTTPRCQKELENHKIGPQ